MKKFRFFLLLVLTLVFTLSFGALTVYADDNGGASTPDTEVATYSKLFSGNDYSIEKEEGLKINLEKLGSEATSKNFLSIGDKGEYVKGSAKVDVTGIQEKTELFYVRFVPDASSSSDTVRFWFDGTSTTNRVYVTFNNDTKEFDLVNTTYSFATQTIEEAEHNILTINEFKIELDAEKVYLDIYSETESVGDSLNIYPYAKLQVYAKTATTFYLKSIYKLDSSNVSVCKADFVTGVSTFVYGAEYYYNQTDSFFARENAIYGYDYSISVVAYDFLSAVDKSLRYTKISELGGAAVTSEEVVCQNYAELVFPSTGVYKVELKVNVVDADYNVNKQTLEEKYESLILKNFIVDVTSSVDSVEYFSQADKVEEYKEIKDSITEKIGSEDEGVKINIGDNFYYPAITEIIKSNYFDTTTLTFTLCYASKANSDYVTTTNKYFEVGQIGKYRYFILPKDECGNGFTYDEDFKEKYEVKEDANGNLGWCLKGTTDIVIPVFTFEIHDNAAPEITIGKENNAFIGKQYKVTSITINASNYDTEYEMYFMTDADFKEYRLINGVNFTRDSFKDSLGNLDTSAYKFALDTLIADGKIKKVTNLQDIAEGQDVSDAFDTTNLTFTPNKGHYYLVCTVVAENGMSSYAITENISALNTPTSAHFEKETVKKFFKNNKNSIILFGVSALCIVGIVVLLTVKPKSKDGASKSEEV